MTDTPLPASGLHLLNRTGQPARVRLQCADRMLWDVWVADMGTVSAPAFRPTHLTLEARLTERATQVTYVSRIASRRAACAMTARLAQRSGAFIFVLETNDDVVVANALRLINRSADALDFTVSFPGSPYTLTGFVKPGGTVQIDYTRLDLVVVQNGLSVQQRLPGPDGVWAIGTASDAANVLFLERLDTPVPGDCRKPGV